MMWNACKFILLFMLATVCHWAVATLFSFCGISVNMMLVFALAFCTVFRQEFGYPAVFLCGLFLDFFGTKLFGNNAFSFTLAAFMVYLLRERLDFDGIFTPFITTLFLTLLVGLLNPLLIQWFTQSAQWPSVIGLLGGALAGALLAPLVFWSVRRSFRQKVR